jgi:hypothetical protein
MTEIEQLRKEINELRERIAQLEARPQQHAPAQYIDWTHRWTTGPQWVNPVPLTPGTIAY